MIAHPDPYNRFRVRKESHRKSKQYVVVFTKRWADKQDPNISSTELRSKKSFKTLDDAKAYAIQKADLTDRLAGNLDTLSLSRQSQLLGLATELAETDTDPVKLLQEALRISRLSLDPIQSITQGEDLIQLAEDHSDKTIGYFMDKFYEDPAQNQAVTAGQTISNIKHNLAGLRGIPVGVLINPKKARELINPVLQEYCNRDDVKRKSSLKHQVARLRQLLKYIQTHADIPSDADLDEITKLKKYKLSHALIDAKEDYALTAAEILIMMKWFLQPKSFCPAYPILAALMGTRWQLFTELEWKHFGGKGRRANSTIRIPRDLLKTVRQGKTRKSISFKTSDIPNLEVWLWYALWIERRSKFKKNKGIQKDLVRTLSSKKIREARQECLQAWEHFFECKADDNEEFKWVNVCENGFRNAFITYGDIHPVVKHKVSLIANDAKSHSHYTDDDKPEGDLEARVLFEMNPMYLELVNLENKTVDTEYLYADLEEKQVMWKNESDPYKKEAYLRILESHDIFPNPDSVYSQNKFSDNSPGTDMAFETYIKNQAEDVDFWKNTSKNKLMYLYYYPSFKSSLKHWVDEEKSESEWNDGNTGV